MDQESFSEVFNQCGNTNMDIKQEESEFDMEDLHHAIDTKEEHSFSEFEPNNEDSPIYWPQTDVKELIRRIEAALPEDDFLLYSTRVARLKWDEICFKDYSGEECKLTWLNVQKRIRRFRLLGEVLQDAKQWLSKPRTSFYGGIKNKHPDMPKKPPSVYHRFYLQEKDQVCRENPGIEMTQVSTIIAQMYKSLSPAERDKFSEQETEEKKEYHENLKEFHHIHPEIPRRKRERPKKGIAGGPKNPQTPFGLYYEDQLETNFMNKDLHRDLFKVQCKEVWRTLPDTRKINWINKALDNEVIFEKELQDYLNNNPNFIPATRKPLLTKEEKLIRERVAGKPTKPPGSAYSLFSSEVLKGNEIKKVDTKERFKQISLQWKNCSEERKEHYKEEVNRLMEEYKQNFSKYLKTLPEEQRQKELQTYQSKRKAPLKTDENSPVTKKKKAVVAAEIVPKIESPLPPPSPPPVVINKYPTEPVQPPLSAFALFSLKYSGKKSFKDAWKKLKTSDKIKLDEQLDIIKRQYLKEYVKFLKSLSKDELREYKDMKTKRDAANIKTNVEGEDNNDSDNESDSESSDIDDYMEDDDDY